MFKKLKMYLGESIAKIFNLLIEVLDNIRDLILAIIGEYDMRANVFNV